MRFITLLLLFFSFSAHADNVILMIGDGMGKNHIRCVSKEHHLFLKTLNPKGEIKTYSANNEITDSAASATTYSCGIKTNNGYLGLSPNQEKCETLAEMSIKNNFLTFIRTTDKITGATPSAFYAHQKSRHNTIGILSDLKTAKEKMDIKAVKNIDTETKELLSKLKNEQQPFFIMIEESETDKQSHLNNYQKMKEALIRFDNAIQTAYNFVQTRNDTTLIVLADHETGGLTSDCEYTKNNHTGENVYYYTFGSKNDLFNEPILENTSIHHKIKNILFQK